MALDAIIIARRPQNCFNIIMTQSQALEILKTGVNVFLTGEPGSGKTHLVNEYVAYLREHEIEPAITASTGIAATHIGGFTIHSWCGIGIKKKLDKYDLHKIVSNRHIIKRVGRAKVLILDEVSMLLPETLNMAELVCRAVRDDPRPFGGLQIILVGDFFQLPPVVRAEDKESAQIELIKNVSGRFACEASAWLKANFTICYLNEQFRQDDKNFLDVLTAIRCNKFGDRHLCHIETRKIKVEQAPENVPKLFSHNFDVDRVNEEMLAKLPSQPKVFAMFSKGPKPLVETLKKGCLSPEKLHLKIGAKVIFTKNNLSEGFVNGTLGVVEGFNQDTQYPIVKIRSGRRINVSPMEWTIEDNGRVRAKISQFPLRLAWAITVHKSQGMSLDEAVVDLGGVFEFGQGYVALSRVRRLSGLHILGWNEKTFLVDPDILAKDQEFRAASKIAEETLLTMSQGKITNKQNDFIAACGGKTALKKGNTEADTYFQTLALWNAKKTIAEIIEVRELKESTIVGHIEKLVARGVIGRDEAISRLLTPALEKALPEIHEAFAELGTDKLSPVFEKFAGKYSYDQLRIARIIYRP